MSIIIKNASHGPKVVTDGLVLCLDAGNSKSYPGSGTTWTDLSGRSNNGTLTNGPTYSSVSGGSLVFDGTNDFVNLGTPPVITGRQVPLTICGWARANTFTSTRVLWGVYNQEAFGQLYSMIRTDNGILKYFTSNSTGGFQSNGTFTPSINTWNFYAVTVSGTLSSPSVTIYLNNSSETFSYSTLTSSPDLSIRFCIGADSFPRSFWNGNISNVMWYNRALSTQEIQQNYNALKSRYI
jgi:hypothetical protein